jgi:hypothetical protein
MKLTHPSSVALSIAVALIASMATLSCTNQLNAANVDAKVQEKIVLTHHSRGGEEITGTEAVLLTTQDSIFVSVATKDLIPGNAYTLWLVVINKPDACSKSPCRPPDILEQTEATQSDVGYAGGLIARADGTGHFTAYQPVGTIPQAWYGNGLQDASGAEIHLVINDHGPVLGDMISTMLGSYRGGCTDASLPPPFPDTAKADGEPGPNKCALYQVVFFQQ